MRNEDLLLSIIDAIQLRIKLLEIDLEKARSELKNIAESSHSESDGDGMGS